MYTVVETAYFQQLVPKIWDKVEHEAFVDWISTHPLAGDVIPGTGKLRKLRWSRSGMGKQGGARVIYFNRLENGSIVLLAVYAKSVEDNLSPAFLRRLLALEEK